MIPDVILFFGLALVAVASALGMLFSKNAVYSALMVFAVAKTVIVLAFRMSARISTCA